MATVNATPVIQTSLGTATVNNQVIPWMRSREVEFNAVNLRPGRLAQFFFGSTNVTRFVQRASRLLPDLANAANSMVTTVGERLYCNTTHAMASVIGSSQANTIYLNENYICVNISPIGANTLGAADYQVGSIVFQSNVNPGIVGNVVFEAQVVYYNSSDKVLALQPLFGTLTCNATSTANFMSYLWLSGGNKVASANTRVQGANFPVNGQVSSLDNTRNRFLVGTYDHRMGVVAGFNPPNANCVIINGTAPSDVVGNLVFISGQTGLGQVGQVLTVTGNVLYTNVTFSPYPAGNSYYSLGAANVDLAGRLCGVYNLPASDTVVFPTGAQVFTISDSSIVDDPNATMTAQGTYIAQGYLGAGISTYATPVVQPTSAGQLAVSSLLATAPSATVPQPQVVSGSPGPNTTYAGVLSQLAANAAANGIYNGVNMNQIGGTFSVSPISQTFTTPKPQNQQSNYGVFVSSVDIWFGAAPVGSQPQFPVQLSLVEVVNGFPTQNVIATAIADFSEIVVTAAPDSINVGSLIVNNKTVTRFNFPDPVYLNPATDYAMTLYSESPSYEVFVAKVGSIDISTGGANGTRRVSSQPSVGSFFTSQNASQWNPIPNQMLMFVLNKAQFSTAPLSFTFNMVPIPSQLIPYDSVLLHSSDLNFSPCYLTYKLDTILANTFAPDPTFTQVIPNQPWDFGQDLTISSAASTRRRILLPGNSQSMTLQVSMQTQNPDLSPVFNGERLSALATTNIINNGQINQENISITNGGNHINAANIVVTIGPPDLTGGTQATANVMFLTGNSVTVVTITSPGSGYSLSPTITLSEPSAPANATAVIAGENGVSGGNALSRYITRPITLSNGFAAGDLRVWISAIMPQGTAIKAYYKVLGVTDSQPFANVPWVQMVSTTSNFSPDQLTPIEIEFVPALGPNGLPSGILSYMLNGTQYPLGGQFSVFAIKLVFFAADRTVTPKLQSFQAAAYPSG